MVGLPIRIGVTGAGNEFTLPLDSLRRHAVVLGSSGSGKTVLGKVIVEECISRRMPVLAVDLQGDLAALALEAEENTKFRQRVEVKVWTPASKIGIPISGPRLDIDELFGLYEGGPASNGKARLSIVSLVGLDEEQRQHFVAALCRAIYTWMQTLDGSQLWGLLYLDEVSGYVPPVREPVSKEPLMLVLRQARKFGLCVLMGSQSPGDIDYKALGQIGTWAIGKLSTQQELRKIEPHLLAHGASHEMLSTLPRKRPGEFILLNDANDEPVEIKVRQTYTPHRLVSQEEIRKLVSDQDRTELGYMRTTGLGA